MAITIEQLDNRYREKNATIILGENILLKFVPEKSVFDRNDSLRELISTQNFLLGEGPKNIGQMVNLSNRIKKRLEHHIQSQELAGSFLKKDRSGKPDIGFFERHIKPDLIAGVKKLEDLSQAVDKLEDSFPRRLGRSAPHYFCDNCIAYIGTDIAPSKCTICGSAINIHSAVRNLRYLEPDVFDYLGGKWFEDYIGKIFESNGWKVWKHGSVMGTSGEKHPIDVLAANNKTANVLVAECKISQDSFADKDMLAFKARWHEISAAHGFFIVLGNDERGELQTKRIFARTPGLCFLSGMGGMTDAQIYEQITSEIA
ncbi:hypothetical protein C4568_01275 [Candidatus Parcubacteria bacterium]|nr:MAG: hypothetical protein C4568_01275 [Candidatus Parcubacteria bacterium]